MKTGPHLLDGFQAPRGRQDPENERFSAKSQTPGFYMVSNITVRGVDRFILSAGLTVKAERSIGKKMEKAFTTQKGTTNDDYLVQIPGSYIFEGLGSPCQLRRGPSFRERPAILNTICLSAGRHGSTQHPPFKLHGFSGKSRRTFSRWAAHVTYASDALFYH